MAFGATGLQGEFMDLSWWDWLSGPSVALTSVMILATWTTTGTFMLMFLAGLQNIPEELEEAAEIDGASPRQRFFRITLPLLKPTLFLVVTLGLIGTWQVFDQVYTLTRGGPGAARAPGKVPFPKAGPHAIRPPRSWARPTRPPAKKLRLDNGTRPG